MATYFRVPIHFPHSLYTNPENPEFELSKPMSSPDYPSYCFLSSEGVGVVEVHMSTAHDLLHHPIHLSIGS